MIRRLNYTGRKKIYRSDVHLSTREENGKLIFDADLRLDDYSLPADASVFVEAYRQATWMRFPFGTVANRLIPSSDMRRLSEFDSPDGMRFRVKVTKSGHEHVILAEADAIPLALPEDLADKESLLPVVPADLGEELWRVDISDGPRLLVNKNAASDWQQLARSYLFFSLVYPAVLRHILTNILTTEHRDTDDETDWRSHWLRFASLRPGIDPVPTPVEEGLEEALAWADEAVAAFARELRLKEKFVANWQTKEDR